MPYNELRKGEIRLSYFEGIQHDLTEEDIMRKIRFAHISDTHFDCKGASQFVRTLSKEYSTKQKLIDLLISLPPLDFILLTGDLVHEGEAEDYSEYRQIFDTYAPATPLFCAMGNHDKRPQFARGFLGVDMDNSPYLYSRTYGDLRIICLDSAFEYGVDGYISPDQTKWLEEQLSVPYGRGTIILSHHPFISEAAGVSAKVNQDFERIVRNSDIIGFFNGHIHTSCYSFYLNKPHITAESMSFGIDMANGEAIYSNRTGYSLCCVEGREISVASRTIPSHFTELQRKRLY